MFRLAVPSLLRVLDRAVRSPRIRRASCRARACARRRRSSQAAAIGRRRARGRAIAALAARARAPLDERARSVGETQGRRSAGLACSSLGGRASTARRRRSTIACSFPALGFADTARSAATTRCSRARTDRSRARVRGRRYQLDFLLPGIGYRMKHRRYMFVASVRTGVTGLACTWAGRSPAATATTSRRSPALGAPAGRARGVPAARSRHARLRAGRAAHLRLRIS